MLKYVFKLAQLSNFKVIKRSYAKPFNTFGRRNVDTNTAKEGDSGVVPAKIGEVPEQVENIAPLSGAPEEHIKERLVRIYKPPINAMQQGTYGHYKWHIEFDTHERWENVLMGWGSSGDPMSSVDVEFPSKEDAIIFCERMGYKYYVEPEHERKIRTKSYGENFSWNKKTRISTK